MRRTAATLLMLHAARALQRCVPPRAVQRGLARRRKVKANADAEAKEPGVESYNALKKLAADFMQRRNKGDINGIVKDLAPKAEIYGLTGDKIKPGLEDFFKERPNLQHEMVEEPWQLGDSCIEYRFEKTWDGGSWNSYDIEEQRDKVERLVFEGGKLKREIRAWRRSAAAARQPRRSRGRLRRVAAPEAGRRPRRPARAVEARTSREAAPTFVASLLAYEC